MPSPPPPESVDALVRRMDRRGEHDQLIMLRLSVSAFEDRFDMPSWMAHRIMRGEPVPEERVRRHRVLNPDSGYPEYLEGRSRIRRRLEASAKDVNEWLDQYETVLEIGMERAQRELELGKAADRARSAQETTKPLGLPPGEEGDGNGA